MEIFLQKCKKSNTKIFFQKMGQSSVYQKWDKILKNETLTESWECWGKYEYSDN